MYGIATMLRGSMFAKNIMLGISNRINNAARVHARWRVVSRARERVRAESVRAVEHVRAGGAAGERVRAGGSTGGG